MIRNPADVTLPGGKQHTDVTVAPGRMTIATGTQRVDVAADPSAPLEILGDNFTGTTVMVPALVEAAHATRFTYAATSGGVAVLATVVPDAIPAIPIGILSRDLWLVDALDIPAQSIEFRLVDPVADATDTAPPAR